MWIRAPLSYGKIDHAELRIPLSLTARLIRTLDLLRERTLKSQHRVAVLHFHCGEHRDPGDKWNSATGIVNNFLSKLQFIFKDINLEPDDVALGNFEDSDRNEVRKQFKAV